jgi:putative intracellular protease/amidase
VLRDLGQCCVAALTLEGPAHHEMGNAMRLLRSAGAEVHVVSANGGDGVPIGRAEFDLYDALLLPCAAADLERWHAGGEAVAFVQRFLRSGKLVLGFAAAGLDGVGSAAPAAG